MLEHPATAAAPATHTLATIGSSVWTVTAHGAHAPLHSMTTFVTAENILFPPFMVMSQ